MLHFRTYNDLNLHIQDDSSGIKLTINKEKGIRRHLEQVFLPRIKLREKGTGQGNKERGNLHFLHNGDQLIIIIVTRFRRILNHSQRREKRKGRKILD